MFEDNFVFFKYRLKTASGQIGEIGDTDYLCKY